jgi:colanic acid biosynthesis glycosyl transferase WcaI
LTVTRPHRDRRMRVVMISCVFPPEPVTSAQTSFQIAEALAAEGHDVTVIAPFPNRPSGQLYAGFSRTFLRKQQHEAGFELIRCFSSFSRDSGTASRFLENLSFGLTAAWVALVARRPDVIYSNTWPVVATGLVSLVAMIRRVPFVLSVQDLYPESLVTQKRIAANGMLSRWIRGIDGCIARRSAGVVVISERFAGIYRGNRQVATERVHMVPNWADPRDAVPEEACRRFRDTLGIPKEAFVLAYGGNIGAAAGVETVIDALRSLSTHAKVALVVAGEGSRLEACRSAALPLGPSRVVFRAPWAEEETDVLLSMANVLVLPTSGTQSLASVPSKAIRYLLAGRPVLALALPGSDLAVLMEQSGGGWVVEPSRPDLLAAKIEEVARLSAAELNSMGQAGREFAIENLTRGVCLPRVTTVLERTATPPGRAR